MVYRTKSNTRFWEKILPISGKVVSRVAKQRKWWKKFLISAKIPGQWLDVLALSTLLGGGRAFEHVRGHLGALRAVLGRTSHRKKSQGQKKMRQECAAMIYLLRLTLVMSIDVRKKEAPRFSLVGIDRSCTCSSIPYVDDDSWLVVCNSPLVLFVG